MRRIAFTWTVCVVIALLLSGCVQMVLRTNPSLISNFTTVFFEECDLALAEQSTPANLKFLEGLLKSDPQNHQLLTALCMGYTGYALLFVEGEDPGRASRLYLRARQYGLRSIDPSLSASEDPAIGAKSALPKVGEGKIGALVWTAAAWNGWINLNLDQPAALAQADVAQQYLDRAVLLDPHFFHGIPLILKGTALSARPRMLGGDPEKAREYFEAAINLTGGRFLLAHYYFARIYAVMVQDKALFDRLLKEIRRVPADAMAGVCMINRAVKERAERLAAQKDQLFL